MNQMLVDLPLILMMMVLPLMMALSLQLELVMKELTMILATRSHLPTDPPPIMSIVALKDSSSSKLKVRTCMLHLTQCYKLILK